MVSEKLSRLIEILKVMAKEQEQFRKGQQNIKEALADLRRKANVNISRCSQPVDATHALNR